MDTAKYTKSLIEQAEEAGGDVKLNKRKLEIAEKESKVKTKRSKRKPSFKKGGVSLIKKRYKKGGVSSKDDDMKGGVYGPGKVVGDETAQHESYDALHSSRAFKRAQNAKKHYEATYYDKDGNVRLFQWKPIEWQHHDPKTGERDHTYDHKRY